MKQEFSELPLNQIRAKDNYRKTFNDKTLNELADSIKVNGVIEPIIVRPNGKGYIVVAGERRLRASLIAGVATIPAIIRTISDADVLKQQIVENVQREGVPFMEEAYALQRLRDELSLDVKDICQITGKSDAWVYQRLMLTKMSGEAQRLAVNGFLSHQVAVLISRLPNEEDQAATANALARTHKNKLVDIRFARKYVEDRVNANGLTPLRTKRNSVQKQNGNDYCANWKKYLVRFDAEQFEQFKNIVKGRTETSILAEAVESVMLRG